MLAISPREREYTNAYKRCRQLPRLLVSWRIPDGRRRDGERRLTITGTPREVRGSSTITYTVTETKTWDAARPPMDPDGYRHASVLAVNVITVVRRVQPSATPRLQIRTPSVQASAFTSFLSRKPSVAKARSDVHDHRWRPRWLTGFTADDQVNREIYGRCRCER